MSGDRSGFQIFPRHWILFPAGKQNPEQTHIWQSHSLAFSFFLFAQKRIGERQGLLPYAAAAAAVLRSGVVALSLNGPSGHLQATSPFLYSRAAVCGGRSIAIFAPCPLHLAILGPHLWLACRGPRIIKHTSSTFRGYIFPSRIFFLGGDLKITGQEQTREMVTNNSAFFVDKIRR